MTVVIISLTFRARLLWILKNIYHCLPRELRTPLPFPSVKHTSKAVHTAPPLSGVWAGFFLKIHPGHQLTQCSSLAKCPTNGGHLEYFWTSPGQSWNPWGGGGGGGGRGRGRERKNGKEQTCSVYTMSTDISLPPSLPTP